MGLREEMACALVRLEICPRETFQDEQHLPQRLAPAPCLKNSIGYPRGATCTKNVLTVRWAKNKKLAGSGAGTGRELTAKGGEKESGVAESCGWARRRFRLSESVFLFFWQEKGGLFERHHIITN